MSVDRAQVYQGLILTRSSKDKRGVPEIEYWLATELGPVVLKITGERPVLFVALSDIETVKQAIQQLHSAYKIKVLELTNFSCEQVVGIYSPSIAAAFDLQNRLQQNEVEVLESDLRLHDRYLMERFIYGSLAFTGRLIQCNGYLEVRNPRVKKTKFSLALSMLSLDIECAMDGALFSIGLAYIDHKSQAVNEVLMIGTPEQAATNVAWFDDEKSLLLGLCERMPILDPDLIVGWNLINFDLRILIDRAAQYKVSLRLGRANGIATWRSRRDDPRRGYASIAGRVAIDGIDSLRSATWQFPSFSLESVAQSLLGRGKKVENDVDDRIAEIVHNFHHNKPVLAAYNLEDCLLVLDIFTKTNIIDYLVLRAQMTGLELDRAGGSVAAFTNLYLPKLHRGGYVAPNLPIGGGLASPGGYVMDSKPGLYKNVLVLDFKSLYPSIIRTFKVDPMGLIEGLKTPNESIQGFKGAYFDRDKHFLPDIITTLWQQRDQAKKEQDSVRSQAIKIIMNSFYGVLGSGGCRFYDTRLASSITMRGHQIMQTTSRWIEEQGYDVIYGDTDSTFVSLDPNLDSHGCKTIGNDLMGLINDRWNATLKEEFDLDCHLEIEFETHFNRFLMPTIRGSEAGSKKRYAGLIIDPESGEENLIFKGLENVRTDWTDLAKDFQADLFQYVFHDQDPTQFIIDTVKQTLSGALDNKLVYHKQLRKRLDDYVKNLPPQVRAARIADEKNAMLGKSLKYQNKGWISYLMTINGPEPVEYHCSAIDYDHYVEKQLKPIADAILSFIELDFSEMTSQQISLF